MLQYNENQISHLKIIKHLSYIFNPIIQELLLFIHNLNEGESN